MKIKCFILMLLLVSIVFASGCYEQSILPESKEKVIQKDIKVEEEILLHPDDKKFLQEEQTYFYSNGVLYLAERVDEENKVYIYKNDSVKVSTKFPEEDKIYIYENDSLISIEFPEEKKEYIYVSERFNESKKTYIYVNESEFYKNKTRSYITGMPSGNFAPEPLKGEELNSYFKSLNLTEDYIYGMMQFETLGGDPTKEQIEILAEDDITLFEAHGDHTYYAKIPRTVLETKSYNFVRWVGIVEDPLIKIGVGSLFRYIYKNCTGSVKLEVIFYESLNDKQINKIKKLTYSFRYGDIGITEIDASEIYNLLSLNFVKKIELYGVPTLTGGPGIRRSSGDTLLSNITCNNLIKLVLSFEEDITEELYQQIEEISEEIIHYESPDKPMCILINPIGFFNLFESSLSRVMNGFMIYTDSYSTVSADAAVSTILQSTNCDG